MTIRHITDPEERTARATWSLITEPGDAHAGILTQQLGHAAALAAITTGPHHTLDDIAQDLTRSATLWRERLHAIDPTHALALAADHGIHLIDPTTVPGLTDLGHHTPHALWIRGDAAALAAEHRLALSGARASSAYGEHVAAELAAALAADGVSVHATAAYGIDGVVHQAALRAGGSTVAWLASGGDRPYPSGHSDLLDRIAQTPGSAVVSESAPGQASTRWRFIRRQRVLAAATAATVIVEAGHRSGSVTLGQAAAELGRRLGAVPGPITSATSAGCHRLIKEHHATITTSPDDVRALLTAH